MAEKDGNLVLDLVDVYQQPLKEKVDVLLQHQVLSDARIARSVNASPRPRISKLFGDPQGLYRIEIDPPSYLPVSLFVDIKASGDTEQSVTFPIDPKKVKKVNFPKFGDLPQELQKLLEASDDVLGFEGRKGKGLYDDLDDIRKAGLLNIAAKSIRTPLVSGDTVFPMISKISELRGDRFFAEVTKQLREETKNSVSQGLFDSVSGALHHPPEGFTPAGSFKTPDNYGNLQLTFFMNSGGDCVADIDIDDANGLGHVFQVLRNHLTGRPTHPYDIHEILVFHQRINPRYTFSV